MPKKCANCGGLIGKDEDVDHCDYCKMPYHYDCKPDNCVKCKNPM